MSAEEARTFLEVKILTSKDFQCVAIVRDELDELLNKVSMTDVTNLLGRELAPLNVWRVCATEFYRYGYKEEFLEILREIVKNIETMEDVANSYKNERSEENSFAVNMAEIYNSLAAYSLVELGKLQKTTGSAHDNKDAELALKKDVIDNLRRAEDLGGDARYNDYMTIIKGFYELRQGT